MTCAEFDVLEKTDRRFTMAEIAAIANHARGCPRCGAIVDRKVEKIKDNLSTEDFVRVLFRSMKLVSKMDADQELNGGQVSASPHAKGMFHAQVRPFIEIVEAIKIMNFFSDPDTRPACNCKAEGRGKQCQRNMENLQIILDALLWVVGGEETALGDMLDYCKEFMEKKGQ